MTTINDLIELLELQPHPEGGYFKETYRSSATIPKDCLPEEFNGERNHSTGIYYLLQSDDFSAFHKINQDEMWHFYSGDALELSMISEDGILSTVQIGSNLKEGQVFQFVVPNQYWFAARVLKPNSYAFLGCTVSPGFDFKDFTLATRIDLIKKFPQHSDIITALTRQ